MPQLVLIHHLSRMVIWSLNIYPKHTLMFSPLNYQKVDQISKMIIIVSDISYCIWYCCSDLQIKNLFALDCDTWGGCKRYPVAIFNRSWTCFELHVDISYTYEVMRLKIVKKKKKKQMQNLKDIYVVWIFFVTSHHSMRIKMFRSLLKTQKELYKIR